MYNCTENENQTKNKGFTSTTTTTTFKTCSSCLNLHIQDLLEIPTNEIKINKKTKLVVQMKENKLEKE